MSSISLKLGYKYLRSNKGGVFSFTTLLAIIGLSIGISSLISSDEPIDDYEDLINQVKKDANILEASTYIDTQGIISSSYDTRGVSLIGIDPLKEKNMSIIPDYMLVGDLNDLNEDNTIIIGSLLAAQIGAYIGDEVNITTSDIRTSLIGSYPRSVNLEVVGIFELKTEIDQYLTLISHSTSQKIKNLKANQTTGIRLKTNNLFTADIITENIINNLDSNNLTYSSWKNTHGTLFEAIKFEKLLISLMLFLIIAVASILVLSTVVMTVKSKEREIGILLTLGASNKQIVLIFFTQGLIVTLIGIFVGVLLGFLLIYNLNNFISVIESMLDRNLLEAYFINYFPYYINFGQIFLICFFSFLISLISTLIPSFRAIRLNPVEILRHE